MNNTDLNIDEDVFIWKVLLLSTISRESGCWFMANSMLNILKNCQAIFESS